MVQHGKKLIYARKPLQLYLMFLLCEEPQCDWREYRFYGVKRTARTRQLWIWKPIFILIFYSIKNWKKFRHRQKTVSERWKESFRPRTGPESSFPTLHLILREIRSLLVSTKLKTRKRFARDFVSLELIIVDAVLAADGMNGENWEASEGFLQNEKVELIRLKESGCSLWNFHIV